MRAPLPATLPDRLPPYLPGRITVVPDHAWDVGGDVVPSGVRIALPRYGMDLLTRDVPIDPERVRWLTEQTTVRPLDARNVHLIARRGRLYVVDGHHALAAHLVTGREWLPARLVEPRAR